MAVKDITRENFTNFLEKKELYRENIEKIKWDGNKALFRVLNMMIKNINKEK
jgi:hypothetical protein